MNWWRVEVNSSGRILSCVQVAECGPDAAGKRVFYVEQPSQEMAEAAAYRAYRLSQRNSMQARRERNKAAGLCRCSRPKPENRKQCDVCISTANAAKSRAQARVRGEDVPDQPPKSEAFARYREQRDAAVRLEVFEQVHRAWCRNIEPRAFTAWLVAQIRELKGKVAA